MNDFDLPDSDAELPVFESEAEIETEIEVAPIAELDAAVFYSAREDLSALSAIPSDNVEPALKRLGPPPFVRKGFPFLGLLATIYDHVAQRVQNEAKPAVRVLDADDDRSAG